MNCPRCNTLLDEILRAGVLVDVCPRCRGMWLERGELEKIAGRLHEVERDWDDDDRHARRRDDDDDRYRSDDWRRSPKRKRWTELFDIFD
jgi:Zn-finger nucleic acid-binding protein